MRNLIFYVLLFTAGFVILIPALVIILLAISLIVVADDLIMKELGEYVTNNKWKIK